MKHPKAILEESDYKNYSQSVKILKEKYSTYPRRISIETYMWCNAKCSFCPYTSSLRKGQKLPTDHVIKLIDGLAEIPPDHCYDIALHRVNEPFLDERLEYFSRYIDSVLPSARQIFWTNGSTLKNGKNEWINELKSAEMTVSLNSVDRVEYAEMMGGYLKLDAVMEGIDRIHRLKIDNQFKHPVNIRIPGFDTIKSRDFIEMAFIRWPRFNPIVRPFFNWKSSTHTGSDYSELDSRNKYISDSPCGQWFDLHVLANGKLAMCCIDESGSESAESNDTFKHSLIDLYKKREKLRLSSSERSGIEFCNGCNFLG